MRSAKRKSQRSPRKARNAWKLESAGQDAPNIVCNGEMTTIIDLETGRNAICQKSYNVKMDHQAFVSSHLRLWEKKFGKDFLGRFLSGLYPLFNDLSEYIDHGRP